MQSYFLFIQQYGFTECTQDSILLRTLELFSDYQSSNFLISLTNEGLLENSTNFYVSRAIRPLYNHIFCLSNSTVLYSERQASILLRTLELFSRTISTFFFTNEGLLENSKNFYASRAIRVLYNHIFCLSNTTLV